MAEASALYVKRDKTILIQPTERIIRDYVSTFQALATMLKETEVLRVDKSREPGELCTEKFDPIALLARVLPSETINRLCKGYAKALEGIVEKLGEKNNGITYYKRIKKYLNEEDIDLSGEEMVILQIIRELELEGLVKEKTYDEFRRNVEVERLKKALKERIEVGDATVSITLLNGVMGNMVESAYTPAISFVAMYAYATPQEIWMAERFLTLLETVKDQGKKDKIMEFIEKGQKGIKIEELKEILGEISASEEETRDAQYAATDILSIMEKIDKIEVEYAGRIAYATYLIQELMREYVATGTINTEKNSIKEKLEKELSAIILEKIEVNKEENKIKIVIEEKGKKRTIGTIRSEGEYLAIYHTNPTTQLSMELMMNREAGNLGEYEWKAWNLLPIYGGQLIKIKNGELIFEKYSKEGGRKGLTRTISYHSVFTLANYYEAISHEKEEEYAFGIIEKTLGYIMEKLKNGKLSGEEEKIMETIDNTIKSVRDEETSTLFTDLEGLRPLDSYYRESLVVRLEKIKELIKEGRYQAAKNEITRMLSAARTLKAKIGEKNRDTFRKLVGEALTTKNREEARKKIEELAKLIDDPETEETNEVKNTIEEAIAYKQLLEETHPEILQTPKPTFSDDIKQQLRTGLIVGLMSTLGSIVAYIIMAGLLARGSTAILDMLNLKLPTLVWIIIGAAITVLTICLLKKGFIGKGKAVALSVSMGIGIWSYAKGEKRGILGDMEFFAPLSAILWVWDEFDDFQDGYNRLKNKQEKPDITDTLELWLLPMILGMFGTWMGIDQMLIAARIPGRWGFAKYAAEANIPSPWDVVVNAIYEIIAFVFANVIASGARGIGWIVYTIGSVLGSIVMSSVLNNAFSIVFS